MCYFEPNSEKMCNLLKKAIRRNWLAGVTRCLS